MKDKFPEKIDATTNPSLVIKIAKELGHITAGDPDFERGIPSYKVSDIFKYLPHSIIYNGHRGDLAVTNVDISYFSIGPSWEHILVHYEHIPIEGDIYDAFYSMILWLKKNNLF